MNRREFLQRSSVLAGAAYMTAPTFAQTLFTLGEPNLVIGIVSDIHIRGAETTDTFVHTLEYFRSQRVDGVIIAGDMADQGQEPQLQEVANAWYKVFKDNQGLDGKHTEKLFIYGNHDVEAATWGGTIGSVGAETAAAQNIGKRPAEVWKTCFKEDYSPIWMKTIKGYHFIGAHWHTGNIPGLDTFLQQHAQELGSEKPFFYIQHPHLKNTCNGPWAWGQDDGTVTKLLSNYPNAVAFSGHSHSPLTDDRDLWQGAFTSVGTASLSYLYPMPARENTYHDEGNTFKPVYQMPNMDCSKGRQGLIMRVYDNCITMERREFVYDQMLDDNWYLPWPISASEPLTFEQRGKLAPIPQFASGDKVTVTQALGKNRNGEELQQVTVHFPNVLKKRTGVRAFDFEVQVEYEWVDVRFISATKRVFSPHSLFGEAQDEGEVVCVFGLHELPTDRRYRFVVRPCECFGKKGDPICSDWIDGPIVSLSSSLLLEKQFYKTGEGIQVSFKDAPVGKDAWVGIYAAGKKPGPNDKSYAYQYTKVKDGTLSFTVQDSGEYFAVLFQDGGYTECSARIPFFVMTRDYDASAFNLTTNKTVYNVGDPIRVTLVGAPAMSKDWVGIYSEGIVPRNAKCPTYLYNARTNVTLVLNTSGTTNWTEPLPQGTYFVNYFMTDGYTEPFLRKYFVIGKPVLLRSTQQAYTTTDAVVLTYSGLSSALGGQLCLQQGTTWQPVQDLAGTEGRVDLNPQQAGEYKYCVCIDGIPVSPVVALSVTSSTSIGGDTPAADRQENQAVYRLNGTRVENERNLSRGLYIISGEKVLR